MIPLRELLPGKRIFNQPHQLTNRKEAEVVSVDTKVLDSAITFCQVRMACMKNRCRFGRFRRD